MAQEILHSHKHDGDLFPMALAEPWRVDFFHISFTCQFLLPLLTLRVGDHH